MRAARVEMKRVSKNKVYDRMGIDLLDWFTGKQTQSDKSSVGFKELLQLVEILHFRRLIL